jgi:hypothetical protein
MRLAVITVVAGRHGHLRLQRRGLAAGTRLPGIHVVVAMGDPEVAGLLDGTMPTSLVEVPVGADGNLPLARARNAGAARALSLGARLLVLLDVDCVPDPCLLDRYEHAAAARPGALLCGPVAYLPPPPPGGYDLATVARLADPHPARPAPPTGQIVGSDAYELFWSLSFAVTAPVWHELGGFCEGYTGYGGEDTDFGELARRAGVPLCWVGGALAYHQHHPVSDPPIEHARDIVRNATLFRERWGWWPMGGWLHALAELGIVRYDATGDRWRLTSLDKPR